MASAPVGRGPGSSHLSFPRGSWDSHRPCGDLLVYTCPRQNSGFASVPAGTRGRTSSRGRQRVFLGDSSANQYFPESPHHLPTPRRRGPAGWTRQRFLPCSVHWKVGGSQEGRLCTCLGHKLQPALGAQHLCHFCCALQSCGLADACSFANY